MTGHSLPALFFGGAFLANAIPHFVSGVMGRPFQTPFARPPGQGLSSSTVNVLWGAANLAAAYLLLSRLGGLHVDDGGDIVVIGLGMTMAGLFMARHFGRFNGGNRPE